MTHYVGLDVSQSIHPPRAAFRRGFISPSLI